MNIPAVSRRALMTSSAVALAGLSLPRVARPALAFQTRTPFLTGLARWRGCPQLRIQAQPRHQARVGYATDQRQQLEGGKAAVGDKNQNAVRQPARHQLDDLCSALSQLLVRPAPLAWFRSRIVQTKLV